MKKLIFLFLFCNFLFAQSKLPTINSCKLISSNYQRFTTPIDQLGRVIGETKVEEDKDMVFCSASLIGKNKILTAAHCFQGNIEQFIRREIILIPKETRKIVDGKEIFIRPRGCNNENWVNIRECIQGQIRVKTEVKLNQVSALCTDSKGETAKINLNPNQGYPHPFYYHQKNKSSEFGGALGHELKMSETANDFDIAIWNFNETVDNVELMPLEFNYKSMDQSFNEMAYEMNRPDHLFCYTESYGYDPISRESIYKHLFLHIFDLRQNIILTRGDQLRHGDSGGPLICKNHQGDFKQMGINSRVTGNGLSFSYNMHSTLSYNQEWLNFVDQKAVTYNSKKEWHKMVLPYEFNYISNQMNKAYACKREKRREASRAGYQLLLNSLKEIEKNYNNAKKEYKQNKLEAVFIRTSIGEVRKDLNDFLLNCKFSMRGF